MTYNNLIVVTKTSKAALVSNTEIYRARMKAARSLGRATFMVTKEMIAVNEAKWFPLSQINIQKELDQGLELKVTRETTIQELNMLDMLSTGSKTAYCHLENQPKSNVQDWS